MGSFRVISKELKEQILSRIKNDGISVLQASKDHGVSTKTIYNWLNQRLDRAPTYREFARLRKQNQDLLAIIGALTVETKKLKKNRVYEKVWY